MTVLILTFVLHIAEYRGCHDPGEQWSLFRGCVRNGEQTYGFNPKPSDVPLA